MNSLVLTIHTIGHRGVGIGRSDGKVVLVPYTAPGDRVEVEIIRSHKTYDEGILVRLLEASPWRRIPPCPAFGRCGGCHYQHLDNDFQLRTKEALFREMVTHHGEVPPHALREIMSTGRQLSYRSRLECRVIGDDGVRLGFKEAGSHRTVPVENCLLAIPVIQESFSGIRTLLKAAGTGTITLVDVAADVPGNTLSITLQCAMPLDRKTIDAIVEHTPVIPNLKSLFLRYGRTAQAEALWSAAPQSGCVMYPIPFDPPGAETTLTVRPGVFRQVNPYGNKLLISVLVEWVREAGIRRLLDLYAGMGNLSIPLSRIVEHVTAVEVNPQAVLNGIDNARRLACSNISWLSQNVAKGLTSVYKKAEKVDAIILDPPRNGAREITDKIIAFAPHTIIYVSCDPATLARDLRVFHQQGSYDVVRSTPIDMFPQTFHLETVTLLRRG